MFGFSYVIYMTFFAAYLIKEMKLSQAEASGLWAMVGGFSIFCGVIWGGISDLLGRKYGSVIAYLTLALSYAIFALVKTPTGFYASAVIFGLTAWSIPTIMAAAAGDYVGPRLAPAGLGFVTLFFGIGQALGPTVGGYLADVTHSFLSLISLGERSLPDGGSCLSLPEKTGRDHLILPFLIKGKRRGCPLAQWD